MSLLPSLIVFFAVLLFAAASGQQLRDAGLLASQQADRALAWRRAEAALGRSAASLSAGLAGMPDNVGGDADRSDEPDGFDDGPGIETLPSAADSELGELPLRLQRVTAAGEAGMTRVRIQADYAIDGCESAHDEPCMPRVRRIAWRQLPPD